MNSDQSVPIIDGEFEMVRNMYHDVSRLIQKHRNVDVPAMSLQAAAARAEVAERLSTLGPPPHFRLIDCTSTCEQNRVVLVDGHAHQDRYTAISHTWGEEVYGVFDCECACVCSATVPPRCSDKRCPGAAAHGQRHNVVIGDILKMCERVKKAGSEFMWHDGVCIAQHNAIEVEETIMHMGWIYAHAADTVIFLDYVGKPMALLSFDESYVIRWYTRVWTLQEAILSRRRRYCIRVSPHFHETPDFFNGPYSSMEEYRKAKVAYFSNNGYCKSSTIMTDFEAKLADCYEDDSCIAVIEEEELWSQIISLYAQVVYLKKYILIVLSKTGPDVDAVKVQKWFTGLHVWVTLFKEQVFKFPSLPIVLQSCALFRESKHEGDRINSVLGLAGITDFVAPKVGNFEASSIEFFKRAGQELIQEAMFWVNAPWTADDACRRHTWLPCLSRPIFSDYYYPEQLWHVVENDGDQSFSVQVKAPCHRLVPIWAQISCSILKMRTPEHLFRCVVLENGMLELTGPIIWSLAVQFTLATEDNSGLPHMNLEHEHLYANCNILSVDVAAATTVGTPGQAAFAKASGTLLGRVRFPLDMGNMQFKEQILGKPVIQGRLVERGSSFLAHLVFAQYRSPALIVQGEDLEAPVSKIGIFLAHPNFHWLIHDRKLCCATTLNRLVIV
ncbi:hypothetical protein L7F22_021140 [Adiantum nelumboides]|nr:hypothetical protein [Adiantum nelumboides]